MEPSSPHALPWMDGHKAATVDKGHDRSPIRDRSIDADASLSDPHLPCPRCEARAMKEMTRQPLRCPRWSSSPSLLFRTHGSCTPPWPTEWGNRPDRRMEACTERLHATKMWGVRVIVSSCPTRMISITSRLINTTQLVSTIPYSTRLCRNSV